MTHVMTRGVEPIAMPTPMAVLTALSAAMLLILAAWALIDPRQLNGASVWAKPLKFAVSFLVFFATLALVEERLSPEWRNGWLVKITAWVLAAAMIFEMGYITVMAAQQQMSHFNFSSSFTVLMYQIMGVGAVALVGGVAVFGFVAMRDEGARLDPGFRWGVVWGFILSCGLTLVTAGYMSGAGTLVGVQAAGAPALPLMGWSGSVGDIRPSHFLALHAMQVLPLTGFIFDRFGINLRNLRWVAVSYVALTAAVFLQALAGLPLIRL